MSFKLNPLTGALDLVGKGGDVTLDQGFSYVSIPTGQTVTIPLNQQMLYKGDIRVVGDFIVRGESRQVPDAPLPFAWNTIGTAEAVTVPANRDLLFAKNLRVLGYLRVLGNLMQVD